MSTQVVVKFFENDWILFGRIDFSSFLLFFVVLWIVPRASCMLRKHSTSELHAQPCGGWITIIMSLSLKKNSK